MAVDDAALERLRDDLLAAIRDSEHRMRREIAQALSASEARLEARIEARLGARIDASAAETSRYVDASAAETRRHMDVVAEDLTSKIALVAEGVVTLTERLGGEMREGFEVLDRRLLRLEARLLSTPERG